jgi:hypothetical protein
VRSERVADGFKENHLVPGDGLDPQDEKLGARERLTGGGLEA